ncbi:hypothetical protein ACFUC1_06440 [Pedococcus sp. NPDC057267]|uniref:hypothetical protein n=1 Tax=Pedococcus sp. NPDC057267 TaxID=3346077 RepID=UPI00363656BD
MGPAADELDDTALRQEIELLAELLEKVADAPEPLCQAEIDRALHVADRTEEVAAAADEDPGATHRQRSGGPTEG